MLFNSLEYLLFLPVVFLLYWSVRSRMMQNAVILAGSMVFYGWWNWQFLLLMMATCVVNYALLGLMQRSPSWRKTSLVLALMLNFGLLGVFKYFNFFVENLQQLLDCVGLHTELSSLNVILPVGISFYTFQLSGYLVDCYRESKAGRVVPCRLLDFMAFISFFPQLVAGPIERGSDMMPQLGCRRNFSFEQARDGMRQILWGLVKKVLVADNCATMVNVVFGDYTNFGATDLWLGALFFTFQIYGDFSGYSDIAIGSAKLFGIQLSDNFRRPYFSKTIPEFWRRWHVTLMNWFKDYVYIPLGGSRRGKARQRINQLAVFLLSGLWHGSNWTYVLWGFYNWLWFVIPHRYVTFLLVVVGWVIFRSPDAAEACGYVSGMFDVTSFGGTTLSRMPLALIAMLLGAEFMMGECRHPFCWRESGWQRSQVVRMLTYLIVFLSVIMLGGSRVQFIYFQF